MWAYVNSVKSSMESAATTKLSQTTSEFIQVADNWQTPVVSYGQGVSIVLPIVNFGTEELNNLIVEPVISTLVTEWPFEPDATNYLQTEPYIPGCQTKEAAMENRREFTFHFKTRSDVMTGYYPLKFHISYTKAGVRSEEPAELTVFVKTIGKPGSGIIGGNGQETSGSKPRIVVTGFEINSFNTAFKSPVPTGIIYASCSPAQNLNTKKLSITANLVSYRNRQLQRLENDRSQLRRSLFIVNEVIVSLSANVTSLNEIIKLRFAFNSLYNGKSGNFVFTECLIIEEW